MPLRTCVSPEGTFKVGIHNPGFEVENLRQNTQKDVLGRLFDDSPVENQINFPSSTVSADKTDRIYEIANAFPFRGTTFINSAWADRKAAKPDAIALPPSPDCSLTKNLVKWQNKETKEASSLPPVLDLLPRPLLLALAQASTDPDELATLAAKACDLLFDNGKDMPPTGVAFKEIKPGRPVPVIHDHDLYDILGNNPCLPDAYKEVMVLRPGIQGNSEIIGEAIEDTHVFEYLRRNSYIPWGHFASNMANDEIRYNVKDLTLSDISGIRHLYYQRIYVRLAQELGLKLPATQRPFTPRELEALRLSVAKAVESEKTDALFFNSSLWGWNYGFGFAQSGDRLHASHQMIHQQNAMVPEKISDDQGNPYHCFSCGDLVTDFIQDYKATYDQEFFPAYIRAIQSNQRTDMNDQGPDSLIVWEDEQVMLFVPKAQVSEWELQLMTKTVCPHILAADTPTRHSLDRAMLIALQTLDTLGAKMVTSIEFSGRFNRPDNGQHIMYSFIPRLPYAPGTFSEAQLRWISGCFPEDFALACRRAAKKISL